MSQRRLYQFECPYCAKAGDDRGRASSEIPTARFEHPCPHNRNRVTAFHRIEETE